jgi:hypothetical protein
VREVGGRRNRVGARFGTLNSLFLPNFHPRLPDGATTPLVRPKTMTRLRPTIWRIWPSAARQTVRLGFLSMAGDDGPAV